MNGKGISKILLITAGILTVALGIATTILTDTLATILPSTWMLVTIGGAVALLLGIVLARSRYRGGVSGTEVPDVELPLGTGTPGDDIDSMLYRLVHLRQGTLEYRDQIQERLANAAISVIRQRENISREAAVKQLQEGTWTDNRMAASFFAGGGGPQESLTEKIFGSERTPYEKWVQITVDSIVERAELEQENKVDRTTEEESNGFLESLFMSDSRSAQPQQREASEDSGYENATRVSESVLYNDLIETGQWRGVSAFALVVAGWGIVSFSPTLLLLSVVAIGLAAFAHSGSEPPLSELEIERDVEDENPQPGDEVEVTVTLKNPTDTFFTDLRVIDNIPEPMRVVNGSPRIATALRPGSTVRFSYVMVVERGSYEWPVLAIGRDISGSIERESVHDVDTGLEIVQSLRTVSTVDVRSQTSLYSGQVGTSEGGAGLEFFAVREYLEGDPMNRIDWKRYARTDELVTIDFRQERAAQVVLLFDARSAAHLSPRPGDQHALDRGVDAAREVFAALSDAGNLVGIAAYDTVPCWLGPSAGDVHEERARRLLTDHPALSPLPPEMTETEGTYTDPMVHVRRQLSPEAQIMLFSPLTDEYSAEVSRRLDSAGHLVTIISPNPTADRTVGQQLARVERKMRVAELRKHGIRVIDWGYDEPLRVTLERAKQRWPA